MKSLLITLAATALLTAHSPALAQRSKEACRAWVLKAEKARLISGYEMEAGKLTVIVNDNIWNKIEVGAKRGMAKTTVCAVLGPGESFPLVFRSKHTNQIIGEYSDDKLVLKRKGESRL